MFELGKRYKRTEVQQIIGKPEISTGGIWATGAAPFNGMWFIFVNIGESGRTGHNYNNYIDSSGNLHWKGKVNSKFKHKSIQQIINPNIKTYIFTRESNKDDWIFKGLGKAINVDQHSSPVEVEWKLFNEEYISIQVALDDFCNMQDVDNVHMAGKEGAVKYFLGKRYERDLNLRNKAIEIHGTTCKACGFNFEKVYGTHGHGFIEIHHKKALHTVKTEVTVNVIEDLVPLCSNCHQMIHRKKNEVLSVDTLCEMIKNNKNM